MNLYFYNDEFLKMASQMNLGQKKRESYRPTKVILSDEGGLGKFGICAPGLDRNEFCPLLRELECSSKSKYS